MKRYQNKADEAGAVMVEAAISLCLFLLMIIIGIDLLIFAYTSLSLQFVAGLAARDASLANMTNVEVVQRTEQLARRFGVPIQGRSDVFMCPVRNYADCGNLDDNRFDQGDAGDLVALQVSSSYNAIVLGRVVTSLSRRRVQIAKTVVMRREPNG